MNNLFLVAQIIVSLLLLAAILVQSKGKGFGRSLGSGPKTFTRRGLEKLVFRGTFILAGIFILVSLLQLVF